MKLRRRYKYVHREINTQKVRWRGTQAKKRTLDAGVNTRAERYMKDSRDFVQNSHSNTQC